MRNIISVETITETGSQSVTNPIDGIVASPVVNAMLQDERLDEANIIVYQSSTKVFERGLKIRVTIQSENNEGTKTRKDIDYIVANDHSVEMPVGSGKYKHEIYLIEETKRLEGIICQSLCFTNTGGNNYTDHASGSVPMINEEPELDFLSPEDLSVYYKTPVKTGDTITVKSINEVATVICKKINDYKYNDGNPFKGATAVSYYSYQGATYGYSGYSITVGDTTTEYTTNENASENKIGMNEGKTINSAPVVEINYKIYVIRY